MYTNDISQDTLSNNGIASYKHFSKAYKLNIVQRQSGDSKEQQIFRDILLRMRDGECILNDWIILTTRFEDKLSINERKEFSEAVHILTKWEDVDKINIEKLKALNRLIAKILAIHTGGREAKKANSDVAKGLDSQLLLAKGTRVMLIANI